MRCPVCDRATLEPFFEAPGIPVFCNVLHDTREAALHAPRGDVRLGFCPACGMIHNEAFEPDRVEYAPGYENSLHGSPSFDAYARELAERLCTRYDLRGELVVEIGGGRGEFLALLCSLGANRGLLVDPSLDPDSVVSADIRVARETFGDRSVGRGAALVCARHVLEHVPRPVDFARLLAATAAESGAAVYVEVPSGLWTIRDLGIWDIIYEHCSYFVPSALVELARRSGLAPATLREGFGGQFLSIETARAGESDVGQGPAPTELAGLIEAFSSTYRETVDTWSQALAGHRRHGRSVAIWGAGSKGVSFLNTVEGSDAVTVAIDINPRKHGKYVPGTGHAVVAPEAAADQRVDEVLVMNPLYVEEVRRSVERLGLDASVTPVA